MIPRRILPLVLAAALRLLLPPSAAAAEAAASRAPDALEEEARALVANPFAARADVEGQVRFLLEWAREHPRSPLAEVALRMADGTDRALLSHPAAGEEEARQLLAADPPDPLVRDLAAAYLADCLAIRGKPLEAQTLQSQRGVVPRWHVAGPFGRHLLASVDERFPPEEAIDLRAEIPGPAGPVSWHAVDGPRTVPAVSPWELLAAEEGVVYLYTAFRTGTAGDARIHLRTHAAVEVFLNGVRIGRRDPYRRFDPADAAFSCATRAGWNHLLLKAAPPERGTGRLAVRLLDAEGDPLAASWQSGEEPPPAPDPVDADRAGAGARPAPASRALAVLDTAAGPERPHLQAALAVLLSDLGLADEAVVRIDAAAAQAPANAWIQVLRARIHGGAAHLTPARRESVSRAAYRAALEARPDFVPALLGMAGGAAERDRPAEALDFVEKALAAAPECLEALAARVDIATANDWVHEAATWSAAAREASPGSLRVLESAARFARQTQRPVRLLESLEQAARADASSTELPHRLARALAHLGRIDEATDVLRRAREQRPDDPAIHRLMGELAMSAEDWSAAEAAFRDALALLPEDPALYRWLGEALYRQERTAEATEAYRACLERDPDQHELRRLVAKLSGETYAFWTPYAIEPLPELRRAALRTARGGTARVIDQTVLSIYPDGSYANYTHSLQAVLAPHGKHEAGTLPLYGEILEARTLVPTRGGEWVTVEPVRVPGQPQLTMPAVGPGAAVEYTYLQTSGTPFDRTLRFPKWYFRSPDTEEEFILSQYVIRAPKGMPIAYAARNLTPAIEFNRTTEGEWAVYTWTAREMESAPQEEGMPHIDELLPFIEISGRRSWEDVNRILMNIPLGRTRVTADIARTARELTRNADSPRERVRRLHAFVCREIDEAGETGATAQRILERRAGSRRLLLMALLDAAGFDPVYVAVRPPEEVLYPPNWSIPQAGLLPEALLLVTLPGGERIWLDTRHRTLGAGEILEDMSGATAFLVHSDGGTFDTVPPVPPAQFAREEERTIRPAGEGDDVHVSGRLVVRGTEGHQRKELFLRADERLRITAIEDHLGPSLPGVATRRLEVVGLSENGVPFEAVYEADVPDFLHRRQNGRAVDLGLTPLPLLPEGPADPSERETPYHLGRTIVGADRVTIRLPADARAVRLPEEVVLRRRFGLYQLRAHRTDGGVEVRRQYRFLPQRVTLEAWPAFVALAREIERAEEQTIAWSLPAAAPAEEADSTPRDAPAAAGSAPPAKAAAPAETVPTDEAEAVPAAAP